MNQLILCLFRCEPVEEYRVFAIIYRAKKKYSLGIWLDWCVCVRIILFAAYACLKAIKLSGLQVRTVINSRLYFTSSFPVSIIWFATVCIDLVSAASYCLWLECNQILHIASQILVVLCHFSCFTIISTTRTTATQHISTSCFYTLLFYFYSISISTCLTPLSAFLCHSIVQQNYFVRCFSFSFIIYYNMKQKTSPNNLLVYVRCMAFLWFILMR